MLKHLKSELKQLDYSAKSIKKFGLILSIVSGAFAVYLFANNSFIWLLLICLSLIFLILSTFFPSKLLWLYKIWMFLGMLLGLIVSHVIIAMTFFVLVTPIALILKVMQKDILNQKINKETQSYWIASDNVSDKSRYTQQF